MTHSLTHNLRVVFSISDVLQEVQMTSSTLKLLLCDTTKTLQLPCTKPATFDFPKVQMGSRIEFDLEDLEGNVYGYSELPVPEGAFYNREVQVNQPIHFYLNNAQKEFISAKIFIIFLNTEVTMNSRHSNSIGRLSSKLSVITSKSPNQSFSAKKIDTSSQKKTQEKLANTFVDNIFNHYSQDIGNISKGNCDSNNQSVQGPRSALSPQASFDNLNSGSCIISPIQIFTPKNPVSTRDHYISLNSTINENADMSSRTRGPASTTRANSSQKYQEEKKSLRKPSGDLQQSSLADFRNQINLIYQNRTSSRAEKEVRSFAISIDQKVLNSVNNSLMVGTEAEQAKLATFCPNSVNPSNRDKPVETQNQISAEKLREKFKEKIRQEEKKALNKKRNPSSSPGVDKKNCIFKSPSTEINALKAQIEQLQNYIKAKDAQLAILESLKKENEDLKLNMRRIDEMREVTYEATEEDRLATKQLETQISELANEKQELAEKNSELLNRIEELERLVIEKMGKSIISESHNLQLGLEIKDLRNVKQQFEKIQVSSDNANQQIQEERKKFADALLAMQQDMEEVRGIVSRLTKEKKEIKEDLLKVQAELDREKMTSQELKDELYLTQKSVAFAESYRLVIDSLEIEKQDLIKTLLERKKGESGLHSLLESNKIDFANYVEEKSTKEEQYVGQISELRQELKNSKEKVGQLSVQLSAMKNKFSEIIKGGSKFEQIVSMNKDIEKQLEASNSKLAQAMTEKEKLTERVIGLLQDQEVTDSKVENAVYDPRECFNEKDEVIENLKGINIEEFYIPANDDLVDFALARFINLRNDVKKLKILLVRENKGIYHFGTKRVFIKLEGEKIIARVGGGYLAFEEFLNQYMQPEYDKITKNGAIAKQATINKTLRQNNSPPAGKRKPSGSLSRDVSPTGAR